MKVVAITQARMTSTRLPGKVMKIVAGKSLLAHHVERVARAHTIDAVVVATTTNSTDDVIAAWCATEGVACHRGPEDDVLRRYVGAARAHRADVVVRVTSDCPLIDPEVIDRTVSRFIERAGELDYASNRLVQTYPRGLDTEVLSARALFDADREAVEPADREHVTLFVWRQPNRFRLLNVSSGGDYSQHRWTVDTPEDFELVRRMIEDLCPTNPEFGWRDCLACLDRNPDWFALNAHVRQKELGLSLESAAPARG